MSVPLKRKPLPVQGAWLLTDHDGKTAIEWIFAAVMDLGPLGWRGTPIVGPSNSYERAEFNADSRLIGSVQVALGQWLVLELDGDLKVLSEEECAELYDPVED